MIIIGIDPGSRRTGYGVIERSGNRVTVKDYGTISVKPTLPVSERLELIFNDLSDVLERTCPAEAAVEEVFYAKNAKSALVLGQARGVALLALQQTGIPIYEYAARKVKQGVTGSGAASKEQVQYMIKKLFKVADDIPEDAADAVAVALCHSHSLAFREKTATANRKDSKRPRSPLRNAKGKAKT